MLKHNNAILSIGQTAKLSTSYGARPFTSVYTSEQPGCWNSVLLVGLSEETENCFTGFVQQYEFCTATRVFVQLDCI